VLFTVTFASVKPISSV